MRISLRIYFDETTRMGPGKAELLEKIAELGSISAAGRAMDMSYRRAWKLVEELNSMFREPLVWAQTGGTGGGRAALTEAGRDVLRLYRAIETRAGSDRESLDKLGALRRPD